MKRIIIIVGMIPFVLLWGEIFTGILFPQNLDSAMNIFRSDPIAGFIYQPHGSTRQKGREYDAPYEINSIGLRDREYGPKKPEVLRVLLLGDSFSVSHGLPIEESLSRQFERSLQNLIDSHSDISTFIEVINASVGGYSPYNYWKAYRRWATVVEPDVVMVGWSPDDYDSSNAGLKYIIENGAIVATLRDNQAPTQGRRNLIRGARKWLSWNSQLYILLRNYLYYNDFVGSISLLLQTKSRTQTNQFQQFMVPQTNNMTKAWEQSFYYLSMLYEDATADNAIVVLVPIPMKMEVIPEEYQRTLSASALTEEQFDINQPLNQIAMFCDVLDIPMFDPRPALKQCHAELPCYFVYDGHWNAEGVRAAADYIAHQWHASRLPPWSEALQTADYKDAKLNSHQMINPNEQ